MSTDTETMADIDLYETLQVDRTATLDDIKKQYRKLSLRTHPDRHASKSPEEQEDFKAQFQAISFAYTILSDPAARQRYDVTGSTETLATGSSEDILVFYKELYESNVTTEAIDEFAQQYKGSDEERRDVLAAYESAQGDMAAILDQVLCSSTADEDRFRAIIDAAISAKEAPSFSAYAKEEPKERRKRKRREEAEAKEAAELAEALGLNKKKVKGGKSKAQNGNGNEGEGEEDALRALILQRSRQRQAQFDAHLDILLTKYPPKPDKGAKPATRKTKESNGKAAKTAPAKEAPKPAVSEDEDELDDSADGEDEDGYESVTSGDDEDDEEGEEEESEEDEPPRKRVATRRAMSTGGGRGPAAPGPRGKTGGVRVQRAASARRRR
ncbi:hypothetical protein AMAG_01613 [Allomyces macrogynus ATCC 38327]|uniref:J domain-containing protein n=1 Tax=Allomyces macrogynus (strain ATCC 38327) TaxID=578462 RepID=A0A0L0S044_ALLM3|nr:hypothetical protein AMAG_01613 [Allomyces macrogynus ATCC 38327]|eukprot:KNE55736.1 hypothetical protein AMAG_01613 [Allomyces macrogynus ATCC 38327]